MQDKIFFTVCFGFLLGVLWRSFILVNFYFAVLLGLISFAIFLLFLVFKNNWGIVAAIFVFALSLGVLRFHSVDVPAPESFETRVGEKITLSGIIVDEPNVRENNQHLIIKLPETKVLVIAGLEENYKYGDEIKVTEKLQKPENFETDQGKIFDYVNYLRKDGILYTIIYPDTEIISRGHGNPIKRALFFVKGKFLEKINFAIASPENLLMGGLILGERAAFSGELRQNFIDTGTIHIVALSGYNVMIVAEWIRKILAFLPPNLAFGAGIIAIFLFVLMTGGSATAVRAGIMAALALIARATGRDKDASRALLFTAVAMLLFNPYLLVYDVSFELSFLATIAVIFFTPKLEKYFSWVTKKFDLREIFAMTTAAYLFVFPFILYKMGNLSLSALPANILVLPFIPATMLFGFLTGFFGLFWQGLALPFGIIAELLLTYELGVIGYLAQTPFSAFTVSYFPLILTITIYAGFFYFLFGQNIKNFLISDE